MFNADAGAESGSAYIFQRDQGGTNNWGEVKKLTASDAAAGDHFGYSVSISGDTAVVGAYADDSGIGSAYVFNRNADGDNQWGQVKKLIAEDRAAGDYYGTVAIDGDTIVIGSYLDDDNGKNDSGSAYVYKRDQGGTENWGQVAKLHASDPGDDDRFGNAVAISGDTIAVGAWYDDDNGADSGSVDIYYRNQDGPEQWEWVKQIKPGDGDAGDYFSGYALSISGDTLVAGAYGDDENGTDSGAAYIFQRDQDGTDNWGQVKKLLADDGVGVDQFGYGAVSISDDIVTVGAHGDDPGGSVYIFHRNQGGTNNWGQVQKITASDDDWDDEFGHAVSISNDTIIVGTPYSDDDGNNSGSAYIFNITPPVAGFEYALAFGDDDGQYDKVQIPSQDDYNFSSANNFTFSAWVKIDELGHEHPIIEKLYQSGGLYVRFSVKGFGNIYFGHAKADFWFDYGVHHYSNQAISTNQWYHVAGVKRGWQTEIYINGVLDSSANISDDWSANANGHDIYIGYANDGGWPTGQLVGQLDQVQVWSTALSASEISDWMYRKIDLTHPKFNKLVVNIGFDTIGLVNDNAGANTGSGTLYSIANDDWVDSTIQEWSTDEDTAVSGLLVGSDENGSSNDGSDWNLTFEIVSQGSKGNAAITSENNFTYTPNADANGADSFTYRVSDGVDVSNTQTVPVTINQVNDAPSLDNFGDEGVYYISTIAGNGTWGYSGDNGPATDAQFKDPSNVCVDSVGNIYITDSRNHRIRKVDTNGIITTYAGNGTQGYSGDGVSATNAQLNTPEGIAIDSVGNLYIADYYNHRIRKVNTSGDQTSVKAEN